MALEYSRTKPGADLPALTRSGLFCVDDLTGSAVYGLAIAAPPQLKGPQPKLSLVYDSNGGKGLAGFGWSIKGLPTLVRKGDEYYAGGVPVSPETQEDGSLLWWQENGTRIIFTPAPKSDAQRLMATRVEDVFGNFMTCRYGEGKPELVTYGLAGDKLVRRIEFDYGADGYLGYVTTYFAETPHRVYQILRQGEFVSEIHLKAFTPEGQCHGLEAPVQFFWSGVAAGGAGARINTIKDPCGLVTRIEYASEAGSRNVVDSYYVQFRDLKGLVEHRISRRFKGARRHPHHGLIFSATTEWDEAAKAGRYVTYAADSEFSHLVECKGSFSAAAAKKSGSNTIAFVHDDGAEPVFHYKTSETIYDYPKETSPGAKPLPQGVRTVQYADEGAPLFTRQQKFFYNDQGLPVKIQQDETTEFFDYQQVQGRFSGKAREILLPAGSSVYDGVLEIPDAAKLLKRVEHRHDFGDAARPFAPTAFQQKAWIGADGGMTLPETVFFDSAGHPKRVKNALGVETEIICDAYHFPKKITYSGGGGELRVEEFETCPELGLPLFEQNHKGIRRRKVYDAFGGLVETWGADPARPESWGDRSKLIRLFAVKTSRDKKTGLILREAVTGGAEKPESSKEYLDVFGQVLKSEKRLGRKALQVELVEYACPGRVARRSLPYLKNGNDPARPEPKWVEILCDDYGRDAGRKFPDGRRRDNSYHSDPAAGISEIRSYETAPGSARKLVAAEVYDRRGMTARLKETDSDVTRYSRDVLGRVVKETDPCGIDTSYQYDGLDRCTSEENPVRGRRRYHFDKSGLLAAANINGQQVAYSYDGFGRVTRKAVAVDKDDKIPPQVYGLEYASASASVYEGVKETLPGGYQLETFFTPHGGEARRKITLADGLTFTLSSEFSANGNLAARVYPGGAKIRYDYGSGGQLKRIFWAKKTPQDWGPLTDPIVEYRGHDCYGRPELTHFHNQVTERRRYNEFGQTTELVIGRRQAGSVYLHQLYGYSARMDGKLLEIEDRSAPGGPKTQAFVYDEFDRLLRSSRSLSDNAAGFEVETYHYGKAGNVTGLSGPAGARDFGGANSYQAGPDQVFDKNGNLVFREAPGKSWRYKFDADNRLLQSTLCDGGVEATTGYVYDIDGCRFLKVDADGVQSFYLAPDYQITLYPDGKILGTIKVQGAGGTVAAITEVLAVAAKLPQSGLAKDREAEPEKGRLRSLIGTGRYEPGIVYLHKNNLGSILLSTGAAGEKTATVSFGVWGEIEAGGTRGAYNFELCFAGMIHDPETGLYYAGDRYYDPDSLRFLSPDRARASTDPYSYTSGDPINYIDYNGMTRWWERIVNWWNSPKTAQTGSRLQRVATVCVNALATATVISDFYSHDKLTADGVLPFVLFMGGFSVTFQTLNFIIYGNHADSCLAPVWQRICCCRNFCTNNQAVIGMVSSTVVSAILFPVSLLTYNGLVENRYDHNATLYANSTFAPATIGLSVPRGMLAGFLSSLPGLALMSAGLPLLAFSQSSVVGSVITELLMYELAFVAFSGGDILFQVLFTPGQFSAATQYAITSKMLIIAPLIANQNPLVAILPISNIPGITTGPLLLADNTRTPFFPPFCCRPCEDDGNDSGSEDGGSTIVELPERNNEEGGRNEDMK
jgi:RHS repeat-associated protein